MKPGDNVDDWIEFVKDRPFNDVRYYLTYEKLQNLGWTQTKNFEEGLNETIEWYKSIRPEKYWSEEAVLALEPHPQSHRVPGATSSMNLTSLV